MNNHNQAIGLPESPNSASIAIDQTELHDI